jgi:DNA-directed RNA polymerase specialized sigma24 family protein
MSTRARLAGARSLFFAAVAFAAAQRNLRPNPMPVPTNHPAPSSGERREVHDAIATISASDDLCESDRVMLFQHYVENRTIEQIAATERLLPRVVRQQMNRALQSMRRALSVELDRLEREPRQS